jgi:NTE family protein
VTTTRALVLAGGGIAGIAWETGILQGIADESADAARLLLDSDVLVGTSAGSAVAAQIGVGGTLAALFDRQVAETSSEIDSGVDVETITELFWPPWRNRTTTRWPRRVSRCSGSGLWRWAPKPLPSRSAAR